MDQLVLKGESLRRSYPSDHFDEINEAIPHHKKAIVGQDRAVKALRFGLGNRAPGFNVYVSTLNGNHKYDIIHHFLEEMAGQDPLPFDWCYVNNFENAYRPNLLRLPIGLGVKFKHDIEKFLSDAERALNNTLESDEFIENIELIKQDLSDRKQQLFQEVNEKAKQENFVVKRTPVEIIAVPLKDNKPLSNEDFNKLSDEEQEIIVKKQREFQEVLRNLIKQSIEIERDTAKKLEELQQKSALFAIEGLMEELHRKYESVPEVPAHLESIKKDILNNLEIFLQSGNRNQPPGGTPSPKKQIHQRYEVNVLVDNAGLEGAPIVLELNPTYNNLFGKIERESIMGTLVTDFTLIREGSLHRANGGYLIVPVKELLYAPFSWDHFKRAIRNKQIEIEDPTEKLGFITTKSLCPEPIPLNVQVILVGPHDFFRLLYAYDDDFKELFKVKAHFDSEMPATDQNLEDFCGYMFSVQEEERLLPLSNGALAKVVEQAHRSIAHQEKMSTDLEETADLLREANFYAIRESAHEITARHVRRAVGEKIYRNNLLQEKIREMIGEGIILIDVEGQKVGQVNGLSVIDIGDLTFGRPSRITATVSIGKGGVIDIEREANLGGDIHSKGVMIMTGYLFEKFGMDKPLSLAIRLVFEQSYGGVDGDSASSSELYAILSVLSDLPIRQDIAVTGSVNQHGEVQAVGGINEKIEGYFEVCAIKGLTGDQGVIIPGANAANLMLKEEVVEAVRQGKFRVWAISRIEEGIEILTGVKAGAITWDEENKELLCEGDTVFGKVNAKLNLMARVIRKYETGFSEKRHRVRSLPAGLVNGVHPR